MLTVLVAFRVDNDGEEMRAMKRITAEDKRLLRTLVEIAALQHERSLQRDPALRALLEEKLQTTQREELQESLRELHHLLDVYFVPKETAEELKKVTATTKQSLQDFLRLWSDKARVRERYVELSKTDRADSPILFLGSNTPDT